MQPWICSPSCALGKKVGKTSKESLPQINETVWAIHLRVQLYLFADGPGWGGWGRDRKETGVGILLSSLSHLPFVIFKTWPHSFLSLLSIMHEPAIANHLYFLEGCPLPPVSGPVCVLFSLPGMFTLFLMVLRNWWSPLGSSFLRKRS